MATETTAHDDSRYRERLYEIRDATDRTAEERIASLLAVGREYLGVESAHLSRITDGGETYEVEQSVGGERELVPSGAVFDTEALYCRRTVTQRSPLALSNAPEQGWANDPAYEDHGLACYLGAQVTVAGDDYGTVCFTAEDPRGSEFDPLERSFVELVARMIGQELERKQYERKLDATKQARQSAATKYESLLQAAPNAIFLVDAGTGDIVEANEAATALTGYDRSELRALSVTDLHPPEQAAAYRWVFEQSLDGTTTRSELPDGSPFVVRRRDGTDVPVEVSAGVVELDGATYVQAIARDISDRLERERELRVKNRAIDEASVGITIADAESDDNEIIYANEEFQSLTGRDAAEIRGRNCRLLQGPDTSPESVAELAAGIANADPVRVELLNYRKDGTPFWNEVSITPVEDGNGEVTHYVGFQRDVTERKRRERIISVLNRVLRHNLRNGMNAVSGRAELLADDLDGEAAEHARRIGEMAWDLIDVSENARRLETAIREDQSPAPRDVVDQVETAVTALRDAAPDADIRVDAPAEATALVTENVVDAIRELGKNAVEHGGDQPTVEIAVDRTSDGRVTVTVADDGPGMPETERALLRGGTETPLEHGNGLGLWLVNWIVTSVGGTLDVTVDDGTAVTVSLRGPDADATVSSWPSAPSHD